MVSTTFPLKFNSIPKNIVQLISERARMACVFSNDGSSITSTKMIDQFLTQNGQMNPTSLQFHTEEICY